MYRYVSDQEEEAGQEKENEEQKKGIKGTG